MTTEIKWERRTRKGIWSHRFNDGLGRRFRVRVTVQYIEYFINGTWIKTMSPDEYRKIEQIVEKKYPGWYHTCFNSTSQENCPACIRKRLIG